MLFHIISLVLLTAPRVSAQNLIDNLSFGHKQGVSPNTFNIPGWSMLGESYVPEILSDKVILTPPYGGGKRGALWSQAKGETQDWSATLEFRAGGVDNGKGNLQLWYAKDGEHTVGAGSVYTAGKFDGLAVVIDTNLGVQKIRGFLNDGSVDYQHHANVDSLAFGHCNYNYRNLGRPSKLEIASTSSILEVKIDGNRCFSTNKVSLPTSYNFGMTAASNEPPDSFEVFKFEVRSISEDSTHIAPPIRPKQDTHTHEPASNIGAASQVDFQDLKSQVAELSKSVANMYADIVKHTRAQEQRHQEIIRLIPGSSSMGSLESKLVNLDRMISELNSELKGGNHKEQFAKISQQLQEANEGLSQHLPSKMRDYVQHHTPRIGFIVFSFMAFQSCCLAVLLWQKWRKSTMPKKFL